MNFRLTTNRLVLLLSVYALMVLNVGVWRVVWQGGRLSSGTPDWVLLLTMPLFLLAVINLLLQLLFWPKVHRLLMPLLLLVGAGVAYGVMVQGIFFNAEMLQNVLQTDRNEASSWLSVKFGLWFVLTGVLPAVLANTYNNTIVYIDHVLASAIRLLSADIGADAALWYVSDHGESLGEGGMYLHGAPYAVAPAEQTHVPMVFWAAPAWYQSSGISSACLQ